MSDLAVVHIVRGVNLGGADTILAVYENEEDANEAADNKPDEFVFAYVSKWTVIE